MTIFAYSGPGPDSRYLTRAIVGAGTPGPAADTTVQVCGYLVAPKGQPPVLTRRMGILAHLTDDMLTVSAGVDGLILGHTADLPDAGTPSGTSAHRLVQPIPAGNLPTGAALIYEGDLANPDELWPGAPNAVHALARAYGVRRGNDIAAAPAIEQILAAAEHSCWALLVCDGGRLYAHCHELPLYAMQGPSGVYLSSSRLHRAAQLIEEDHLHTW